MIFIIIFLVIIVGSLVISKLSKYDYTFTDFDNNVSYYKFDKYGVGKKLKFTLFIKKE
jgi:hypothetical protein